MTPVTSVSESVLVDMTLLSSSCLHRGSDRPARNPSPPKPGKTKCPENRGNLTVTESAPMVGRCAVRGLRVPLCVSSVGIAAVSAAFVRHVASILVTFTGGSTGEWAVERLDTVRGDELPAVARVAVWEADP